MTSRGTSYQLPDLPFLIRDFELRTNPHCHLVSVASEAWFAKTHWGRRQFGRDEREREELRLRGIKAGLLAALCFPTCDAPQLRLATDFLTAIAWVNIRLVTAAEVADCGWNDSGEEASSGTAAWEVLQTNTFFAPLVPQIRRLSARGRSEWPERFATSVFAFQRAHRCLIGQQGALPDDVETFIQFRTDANGLQMLLELSEVVKELTLPTDSPLLELHKQNTLNVIIWALELASYSTYSSANNQWNAVSFIMAQKEIPLQAALKVCMARLKEHVEAFRTTERAIHGGLYDEPKPPTPPLVARRSHTSSNSIWSWNPFSRSQTPPPDTATPEKPPLPSLNADAWGDGLKDDVESYVSGLRDCIVGYINWMYETEIYFGQLGEEVRATGWTFLPPS